MVRRRTNCFAGETTNALDAPGVVAGMAEGQILPPAVVQV
jgi:hypothetical protein